MKKYLILFAVISAVFGGCGKKAQDKADFTVVASFYPVYILAKNITDGVPGVAVVNMTPPVTGCLHDYTMTTDDMKRIEKADLFLINGAGMESFMDKVSQRFPSLKKAELSEGIELIRDESGSVNPHIWVSVGNMLRMAHTCADILVENDKVHAAEYRSNETRYVSELISLKAEMDSAMKDMRGKKIVTFHEAFPYFAKEYGLTIAAVVEREPGSQPSAKELAETIKLVRSSGVKALFAEPQYPSSAADAVARETGAKVYVLDPAVTGDDSAGAYISIMKKNLGVLRTALVGQ